MALVGLLFLFAKPSKKEIEKEDFIAAAIREEELNANRVPDEVAKIQLSVQPKKRVYKKKTITEVVPIKKTRKKKVT
jgi:hypothetical protein